MTSRSRTDVATGLAAAVGGAVVGLFYSEPWAWCVGSTLVVLLLGIAVGAATRGAARFVGFLVVAVAAGGVVASLDHGNLAQGGLLATMGGVLVGTALQRTRTEGRSG